MFENFVSSFLANTVRRSGRFYSQMANNPHEIVQVASIIEQVELMKGNKQLPLDTEVMIVPCGHPGRGAPDIVLYSKELDKCITFQLKYKRNGIYSFEKFDYMCNSKYRNTNNICLMVNSSNINEQLALLKNYEMSTQPMIMVVDYQMIDKNISIVCGMLVQAAGNTNKNEGFIRSFSNKGDKWMNTSQHLDYNFSSSASVEEVSQFNEMKVVPVSKDCKISGEWIPITDNNQSNMGTQIFVGPSRCQLLKEKGIEVTPASLFLASSIGWYDK